MIDPSMKSIKFSYLRITILERGMENERAWMDVAPLVRLPNGDHVVKGSTPTFYSGI